MMTNSASDMIVFAAIISTGGISAAARQLKVRKSTVSRRLALLEERLSTRLIERNTRSLRLTEAGALFYDYCARVAADAEAAETALGQLQTLPQGVLRITTTQPFAETVLGPLVSEFLERYEDVQIHTLVSGRPNSRSTSQRHRRPRDHGGGLRTPLAGDNVLADIVSGVPNAYRI